MELVVLNILNGISFGSILFLVGSGLSLIWGVMGILNLAHGALYMVGAFVGWTIAVRNGMNFWLAVLAAAAIGGLLGLIMERFFFRYLHKQFTEQVLLTFGFIYVLQNVALWIYGGLPKPAYTAPILNVTFPLMTGTYPLARIAVAIIGVVLAVALWWLQAKTRVGAIIRAGMDDKEMTTGLGINFSLVSTLVFCLGTFIAGASGVIGAQLFGVTIELALSILLLALVVVVLGGVGSILGTLVGGVIIGLILSFGKALFPQVSMFLVYFTMIVILLVKPEGILGRKS
jgi:branched-chain amino acid transport system permease protein